MDIAAVVFLTLGILLIGFGLLSLGNILNLGITRHQREHADMMTPKFWHSMIRIMLVGVVLLAVGAVCAILA